MRCSKCNGFTDVKDTRQKGQRIRRRRECRKCGYRFTTFESELEAVDSSGEEKKLKRTVMMIKSVLREYDNGRLPDS